MFVFLRRVYHCKHKYLGLPVRRPKCFFQIKKNCILWTFSWESPRSDFIKMCPVGASRYVRTDVGTLMGAFRVLR
jgi:hypothetical protein